MIQAIALEMSFEDRDLTNELMTPLTEPQVDTQMEGFGLKEFLQQRLKRSVRRHHLTSRLIGHPAALPRRGFVILISLHSPRHRGCLDGFALCHFVEFWSENSHVDCHLLCGRIMSSSSRFYDLS